MKRNALVTLALVPTLAVVTVAAGAETEAGPGFVLQRDNEVKRTSPGPHEGIGRTTGYHFFEGVPGVPFAFRKRALHPGSSIGLHEQHADEIYYVLSGSGRMTIDGQAHDVGPGDAILTRPGSTHALAQQGDEDLVIVIVYPRENAR